MSEHGRFRGAHLLLLVAWAAAAVSVILGMMQDEGDLTASNTIKLMDYGFSKGDIEIVQSRTGDPLRIKQFNTPSPQNVSDAEHGQVVYTPEQWAHVGRLVNQFVAMSNWGLGDPFMIGERPNGEVYVRGFRAADFSYRNPFDEPRPERNDSVISASGEVRRRRGGWLVVSRDLALSLSPGARVDESVIGVDGVPSRGLCVAAKRCVLRSPDGSGLRVSIGSAPVAEDKSERLQVEKLNGKGETVRQWLYKNGDYFNWGGRSFVVQGGTGERVAGDNPPGNAGAEDLVFTKYINGRPSRVHLLGESTTNLLGAKLGGYTTSLDGALNPQRVAQLNLTLDPVLHLGSFLFVREALGKIDGYHPLPVGRQRRGSVTVLDLETGGILADVGYPSFEPDWLERRRVLVNRTAVRRSPASEVHMAGSTVKVLTVAAGYLLFGNARAELLPRSRNDLAIRQAFQNAYGVELTAPLEGVSADITPEARKQFEQYGTASRVKQEYVSVLQQVFGVAGSKEKATEEFEPLISQNLLGFFDRGQLESGFYHEKSRFPILNATSMEQLRNYALGAEDSRFTTLRLAAILGTASEGRVFQPHIVESVLNDRGTLITPQTSSFSEINLPLPEIGYRRSKMREITQALQKVIVPDGTGYFYTDRDAALYLGADDPSTPEINEAQSRGSNYGKSGTADYGAGQQFQDSLFVYRHGRYVIAVWLERSDGGTNVDADHRPVERHPAHKLTHRILQVIEALESQG